jgi:hypothetical protein
MRKSRISLYAIVEMSGMDGRNPGLKGIALSEASRRRLGARRHVKVPAVQTAMRDKGRTIVQSGVPLLKVPATWCGVIPKEGCA